MEKKVWLEKFFLAPLLIPKLNIGFGRTLALCMYIQIFNHNISLQKQHGKPTNVDSRHVGDLGNIVTPAGRFTLVKDLYQSLTPVSLFDGLISLDAEAENGIAGRAIVVHAGEDDLGMKYFGHD